MSKTQIKPIGIASGDASLSKGQKSFNSQIKQIEKLRTRLAAWEAALPSFRAAWTREYLPLTDVSFEWQAKLVRVLDAAASRSTGLSKRERATLARTIIDLAGELAAERNDAEMKEIYNKHSASDFDEEVAEQGNLTKAMMEELFGMDLGDAPIASEEELAERLLAEREKLMAQEQSRTEQRSQRKKKSATQLAKEAKQAKDAEQVSQSIREVYRKLASALHPDRETDAAERTRKTQLMQRANQAYEKRNLLQLLELQLELEYIDAGHMARLDEEKLRHYNLILKEQVAELKMEIDHIEDEFRLQFGFSPFEEVKPETIQRTLQKDIRRLQQDNLRMAEEVQLITELQALKRWLKEQRFRPLEDDFDSMFF